MENIEPIRVYGELNSDDLKATLAGLDGTYAASDLYARYQEKAKENGRVAASQRVFGAALRAAYCWPRRVKGRAAWMIWAQDHQH